MTSDDRLSAPPGWYPDPGSAGQWRYWSGADWTDQVRFGSSPPAPPVGPPWSDRPRGPVVAVASVVGLLVFAGAAALVVQLAGGGDERAGDAAVTAPHEGPGLGDETGDQREQEQDARAAVSDEDVPEPTPEMLAGAPQVTGRMLALAEDLDDDPTLGQRAPNATGTDFDGHEVAVGDGEVEVVLFLASWCPACQLTLEELVPWLDEGRLPVAGELTVVVTGLSDQRPNWPPDAWLEAEGYRQPVLVDDLDGTVAESYGLTATPFWVMLRDGEVRARVAGELSMEELERHVRRLVDG